MGRGATKAAGNVYYQARIEAAKWNGSLSSREGAAEALGVSVDTVKTSNLAFTNAYRSIWLYLWQTCITLRIFLERTAKTNVRLDATIRLRQ